MRFLVFPVLFLVVFANANATEKKTIKIPEAYIVKDLFSCKLESQESFHFVIAKNKNNSLYSLIPINEEKSKLNALSLITFDFLPNIVSYHNNEDVLTIVVSNRKKGLTMFPGASTFVVVDVNCVTQKSVKSKPFKSKFFKKVVRKEYESLLLFCDGNEINIKKIINSNYVEDIAVKPKDDTRSFFVNFRTGSTSSIFTEEYVGNGSTKTFKLYAVDNELIITKDNKSKGRTLVLKIPLDKGDLDNVSHLIYDTNLDKIKSLVSYYHDNKLYQLVFVKEIGMLNVYDFLNNSSVSIDLNDISIHYAGERFKSVDHFINNVNRLNNSLTLAVNETLDLNKLVRIDYVNLDNYNYDNKWWFNHDSNNHLWLMQQQKQFFNNNIKTKFPNRFGPSVEDVPFFSTRNENHFEILLDLDSKVVQNDSDITFYKDIDREELVRGFLGGINFQFIGSSVFSNSNMYNMIYNKKTKILSLYKTPV